MSKENWLIYPTVGLFVYDLAEGVGQSEDKIDQNHQQFWQKIYGDKISALKFEQLKQAETETADYIKLLGNEKIVAFESTLDGYCYPVKISDTYAALFDLAGRKEPDDKKFAPEEIDRLGWQKEKITSRINPPATIGQSWLVWGQLTTDDQDALVTAKNCYTKLNLFPNPKWQRDLKAEGQFLGANFYELWLPPGDRGNISENYHVLICLFPYNSGQSIHDISKTIGQLYMPHLIRLFAYRNKVICAYTQSRQLKSDLKDASQTIQKIFQQLPAQVNSPKIDLKKLQCNLVNSLKILLVYANYISELEEQESTISTNLENYTKRLKTIGDRMGNNQNDFKFMTHFSDFAKEKYLSQVAADNRSLSPGLRLLDNVIETIEGIIEIERAKSDRTLNVTIGAVVGIATSGVYASVYAGQIAPPKNPLSANTVFWSSISWGFLFGALGAIFLIIIGKKWR